MTAKKKQPTASNRYTELDAQVNTLRQEAGTLIARRREKEKSIDEAQHSIETLNERKRQELKRIAFSGEGDLKAIEAEIEAAYARHERDSEILDVINDALSENAEAIANAGRERAEVLREYWVEQYHSSLDDIRKTALPALQRAWKISTYCLDQRHASFVKFVSHIFDGAPLPDSIKLPGELPGSAPVWRAENAHDWLIDPAPSPHESLMEDRRSVAQGIEGLKQQIADIDSSIDAIPKRCSPTENQRLANLKANRVGLQQQLNLLKGQLNLIERDLEEDATEAA